MFIPQTTFIPQHGSPDITYTFTYDTYVESYGTIDGARAPPRHTYAGAGACMACASYASAQVSATATPRAAISPASCSDSSVPAGVGIPLRGSLSRWPNGRADLDLFRRGGAGRRLVRPFCAAQHQDPELEVMPKTRERDSGLLRRDLRAGEVLLKPATRR